MGKVIEIKNWLQDKENFEIERIDDVEIRINTEKPKKRKDKIKKERKGTQIE